MHRRSITLVDKHRIHPLKILYPGPAGTVKNLDDENTKTLYSPSVPIILPQMRKSFPLVILKRF